MLHLPKRPAGVSRTTCTSALRTDLARLMGRAPTLLVDAVRAAA